MAFLDKLMFWKKDKADTFTGGGDPFAGKDEPFGPGNDPFAAQQGFDSPSFAQGQPQQDADFAGFAQPMYQETMGQGSQQAFGQQQFPGANPSQPFSVSQPQPYAHARANDEGHQSYLTNKNLEVVQSKLDALRASIDSMSQRLENIERAAYQDREKPRYNKW